MYTYSRGNLFNEFVNSITVDMSEFEFELAQREHMRGVPIQVCFANLTADEREFIISGITPSMWDDIHGVEDYEN